MNWLLLATIISSVPAIFLARLIHNKFSSKVFKLTVDSRSLIGLISFGMIFIGLFLVVSQMNSNQDISSILHIDLYSLSTVLVVAIIAATFWAISSSGFEYFSVPLTTSMLFYIFFLQMDNILLIDFWVGLIIAAIIAFLSYKVKFLTPNGSVATFLLASFIFGLGGWKWSIPMMAFFILSSLLSKVRKKQNEKIEQYFEKTGVRDYLQVLANGGIGGILVILNHIYPHDIYYLIYVTALASVCADTWATEIGTMVRTNTYNILTLKPVEQGISGGISILGTLGGVCGALTISLAGMFWVQLSLPQYFLVVILGGVIGSFFDSLLGATIQAQNQCNVCDKITERDYHCGEKANHKRGYKWVNNDVVNLFAGLAGGAFIIFIYGLL